MNTTINEQPVRQTDGYRFPAFAKPNYPQPDVYARPAAWGTTQASAQPELPIGGFKPLTKAERDEAARIKAQEGFSWAGYQVVHKELFSHKFDPTLTIRESSITFNNACISRLEQVVYVQLLINPEQQKLVIRPCQQDARDAIRWCIEKGDKRKSRQITCRLFAAKLYELMGWDAMYRYKLQGTKIDYQGEELYVFDLSSTEVWLPQTKETDENGKVKRKTRPPIYPANWRDSFGLPVEEHAASMQVDLSADYDVAGMAAPAQAESGVSEVAE